MERTKKFLEISIGTSLIILSLSILIFSVKQNMATAQIPNASGYQAVGVVNGGVGTYDIIGYNPKTGGTKILTTGHY